MGTNAKSASHLETSRPCTGFPKKCQKCKDKFWCFKYRQEYVK